MSLSELRTLGSNWKKSFPELRFLGQIVLQREACNEHWKNLGRHYLSRSREGFRRAERNDLDPAVAVVISNLAFFFDPSAAGSEAAVQQGFISWVTTPLGWVREGRADQQLWQERIGAPMRRLLEDELEYSEQESNAGAWRFVRPILRQGGVPLKLLDGFLDWFAPLSEKFDITEAEYRHHLVRSRDPGTILTWFLHGPQGFEFCAAVVRSLRSTDVPRDGVRPELIERARQRFASGPRQATRRNPRPRFALDLATLTLGLRIPDETGHEYRHRGIRVYGFLPLSYSTRGEVVTIQCRTAGAEETFEASVPLPLEPGQWLAFSEEGGRLVAMSSRSAVVPPGALVLVAGEEVQEVLREVQVASLGQIESAGDAPPLYASVCEFNTPCQISLDGGVNPVQGLVAASLELDGVPAIQGTSVFAGRGPTVRLSLPSELPVQAWFSSVSSAAEAGYPRRAEISVDGTIEYETNRDAPTRVRVWVEPVGLAPRSWAAELMEAEFVVFPADTRLAWPDLLLAYDESLFFVAAGTGFREVRANGRVLTPEPDGRFLLPCDEVVGVAITTSGGLVVQLSRRVRRVHLRARELESFDVCPVLFLADLEQSTAIEIELPEVGAGTEVELGILRGGELRNGTTLVVPHSVRRGHPFKIPSRALRDALSVADVGILALRVHRRVIATGVLYAQSPLNSLLPEAGPIPDLGLLEASAGDSIRACHDLRSHPREVPGPSRQTREVLGSLIRRIKTLAAILDRGDTAAGSEADDLDKLRAAVLSVRTGEPVTDEVLEDMGRLAEDGIVKRVTRWTSMVPQLVEKLREQSDLVLLIRRWRDCWSERVLDAEAATESVLYRMEGGRLLTEGARKLFMSLRHRRPFDLLAGGDGALACIRKAGESASDPVRIVAKALLVGAYLRQSDARSATGALDEVRPRMIGAWRTLMADLDAAITGEPLAAQHIDSRSVRVWDLQPQGITLFEYNGGIRNDS